MSNAIFISLPALTAFRRRTIVVLLLVALAGAAANAQTATISVDWNKTLYTSKTTSTLQVVVNPMLHTNSPIHEGSFTALKDLGADYTRFVPWFPYPHMAVAELKPPTATETFWDFAPVDTMVSDFMNAQKGHTVVMNFSTIPDWMFKTTKTVEVPKDIDQVFWDYNEGSEPRDPSGKEIADYFGRLFSWFTKGGFTDEHGVYHKSGHYYHFDYWEVLNEMDFEHSMSPQLYTRLYDAIVTRLKQLSPKTKFVALALAAPANPAMFEYFLDSTHHRNGVKPEGISYHFYGNRDEGGQPLDQYQYSFFNQLDRFEHDVLFIENIRKRKAPQTFTTINEIGSILGMNDKMETIPAQYWNLSGALYARVFLDLTKYGIDVAGESQLVGYPTQYPDVSMMNWVNGKPNSRYWVLRLLHDNFGPGDQLLQTNGSTGQLTAQAYNTGRGRRLLLINQRNRPVTITLPAEFAGSTYAVVDEKSGENPPATGSVQSNTLALEPFAVAVLNGK
jgi:hypothetical protein